MEVDLSYARARKLALTNTKSVNLILAGCGGTGSWLAPSIARVARILTEKLQAKVFVSFIDPDVVEEKNVYRQNFCQAEIGANKAETLALRYSSAWALALPIQAYVMEFDKAWRKIENLRYHDALTVILGCVDNPGARRQISAVFESSYRSEKIPTTWWIDSGNEHANGQILIGCDSEDKGGFPVNGYCTRLPLPSVQHPELVSRAEVIRPQAETRNLSCAELALIDAQSLTINQRMAAEAADFLSRSVVVRDLDRFATYLNLKSGTARSNYITPENVEAVYQRAKDQAACLKVLQ